MALLPGLWGRIMVDWSVYPAHILPRLQEHSVVKSIRRPPRIFADTSNFTRIDYGDIIHVDSKYFLVVGYTREGRFGIDDQPKQWVPKVYDLETGERKIMKLVFYETYKLMLGDLKVTCYRSPEKEAKVIELVRGNPYFMQGYTALDEAGNMVRILDIVNGRRLDKYVETLGATHKEYFETHVSSILNRFLTSVKAISLLHENGFKHGDIRRDHIMVDREDGVFRWIDFDYDFHLPERPFAMDLIGLGNVLLFVLGRRVFRPTDVYQDPLMGEKVLKTLHVNDLSLVSRDRIFNLKKIYLYIPKKMNDILLHFSAGTTVMYDSVHEFYDDLAAAVEEFDRG